MPESQNISDRVKALMERYDLTQTAVAEELLVDASYVNRILKGNRTNLSDRVLERIQVLEQRGPRAKTMTESFQAMPQPQFTTPRQRLKALREAKNLTLAELAKRIGYEIGVLQALEDGSARISEKLAKKLARALDCDEDEFLNGSDHPQIMREDALQGCIGKTPNVVLPPGTSARYVPLISWAQAGTLQSFTDEAYQYEAHLAFNVTDRRAIAVTVRGDSMQPQYGEGDVVVLYPSSEPRNGDLVIARLDDTHGGDVMFKIFSSTKSGSGVILSSYNPAYPPLEYHRTDFAWIYPAASVVKQLRK